MNSARRTPSCPTGAHTMPPKWASRSSLKTLPPATSSSASSAPSSTSKRTSAPPTRSTTSLPAARTSTTSHSRSSPWRTTRTAAAPPPGTSPPPSPSLVPPSRKLAPPAHHSGTAKKFLAAANFLELLRIFEKDRDLAADTSSEDKIRYAKWKAADIAKAFREGRKPTPGPAGSSPVPEPEPDTALPSSSSQRSVSPSAPAFTRDTPPPHLADMPSPQQDGFFQNAPAQSHLLPNGVQSPGSWSTAATPGTPGRVFSGDDVNARARNGPRTARVSGELEGWEDEYGADASADEHTTAPKNVRFAPAGQESDPFGVHATPTPPAHVAQLPLVDASAPPPAAPESGLPRGFVPEIIAPGPGAPPLDDLPDGFVPAPSPPRSYPSTPPLPSPPFPPSALPSPSYSPPSAPSFRLPSAPLVPPPAPLVPPPVLPPEAATVTEMPVELTPAVVARAQKHCRFAISALDYEDTEQARKELRAALRLLGG
ncbi:hypothetical protein AcW1_000866 [Taiwanofungus camphoratus]|nr:hypothetical protein AcW1_000866 [Antrodia cinnamomea]